MNIVHHPVMLREAISYLDLGPGQVVLDATLGLGGHARDILKSICPGGTLIGIDQDEKAMAIARDALKEHSERLKIFNGNFRNLDMALSSAGVSHIDGAIFDLGVSSYQLDDPGRGFSIKMDARLDMRMDRDARLTAYDIVNRLKEKDLGEIIKSFGDERFFRRISRAIVEERGKRPIETTGELKDIIHKTVGRMYQKGKIDPATRTFQAIRIYVNDELGALSEGLTKAIFALRPGRRIVAISFHSLEDRIVKNIFRDNKKAGVLNVLTKKPLHPSDEETTFNPRARSARLRAAERI